MRFLNRAFKASRRGSQRTPAYQSARENAWPRYSARAVARTLMNEQRVPMVVEVMLERATNIAMRPEIDNITGFAPVLGSIEDRVAAS